MAHFNFVTFCNDESNLCTNANQDLFYILLIEHVDCTVSIKDLGLCSSLFATRKNLIVLHSFLTLRCWFLLFFISDYRYSFLNFFPCFQIGFNLTCWCFGALWPNKLYSPPQLRTFFFLKINKPYFRRRFRIIAT